MWEEVMTQALHSIRSLLCTATNTTPHERMFNHPRRSSWGQSMPSWLQQSSKALLGKFNRISKYDPLVEEVDILESNPFYSSVRLSNGRELTVSNRHLAPSGNIYEPEPVNNSGGHDDLPIVPDPEQLQHSQEPRLEQREEIVPEQLEQPAPAEAVGTPHGSPVLRRSERTRRAPAYLQDFQKNVTSTALILLIHLSLHTVDEGLAINPGCSCIRFTSTLGKERGTFSSPDYPRAYPPSLDCLLYTFLAAPHEIVELVFTDFDIYKEHLDCIQGDYLKVYSEGGTHGPGPPGVNEYSAWRALCGNRADAPPALYSHGPLLVLELHTGDKATNATGFVGTYRFIDRRNFETDGVHAPDTGCDYVFNSQSNRPLYGRLYSPRYPSSYPSNVRCSYHFHASCLNRADIIKVFDGRSATAPVLAMLCNEILGYEILSTGPDLLVQFTANSNVPGQGFKASYQFQMHDTNTDGDVNKKSSTSEAISGLGPAVSAATSTCDQVFSSDKSKSGKLSSPLHPAPYPQNSKCHYDFQARGRERIRLVFEDFSLQRVTASMTDCESMDSLDVFLYVDGRLEKMASFCGNDVPKPIMSNGPKMSIEFRGIYSSRHSRGFKISYYFVEDYGIATGMQLLEFPCAFVFNSSEWRRGAVTSPNYPGFYPRDTECNYFFYGNENEKVHLHFTYFDVEGVVPCEAVSASDYVQISNKLVDTEGHRHCGQLKELQFTSERNFLRVTFRSNDRLDGTGFKADYIFLRDSVMHSITMPDTDNRGSSHTSQQSQLVFLTFTFDVIRELYRHLIKC